MEDNNYSYKLLDMLDSLWQDNPEQRFGQLVENIFAVYKKNGGTMDLWNMTTDDFIDTINKE